MSPSDQECIVALGHDVDMPRKAGLYLNDRATGWPFEPDLVAHGQVNDAVETYVRRLMEIAEDRASPLQFFLQGNAFEASVEVWRDAAERGHAPDRRRFRS